MLSFLVFWVILSVLVAVYADKKGRSGPGFFLLSLLVSPIIGFLVALLAEPRRERVAAKSGMKKCPDCGEYVRREARVCRFCRHEFRSEAPEAEAGTEGSAPTRSDFEAWSREAVASDAADVAAAQAGLKGEPDKAAGRPLGKAVPAPSVLGRKRFWWDQTWVRILFALIVVVVLLDVVDHIFSPKSAAKVAYVLPKEFTLRAQAARGAQGEAYISGRTNFPDGMKMWVEVEAGKLPLGAPNVIAGDENVVVRNGGFRTTGLWKEFRNPNLTNAMDRRMERIWPSALKSLKLLRRPLSAGRYKVHFSAYFNGAWQTAAVLSALGGQEGRNLHGKLLKQTDPDVVDSPKVLDYVAAIDIPPLSQDAKAISLVKAAVLTVPGEGRSALNVESNVIYFSLPTGWAFKEAKGWNATAQRGTVYRVSYDFINGGQREEQAIWTVDLSTGKVRYVNEYAKVFSWTPSP